MTRRTGREGCEGDRLFAERVRLAGMSLPTSQSADEIRDTFVAKVEAARSKAEASRRAVSNGRAPSRRLVPALGAICIAVVFAAVLFASIGFATVSAMPGNPLYSVKRAIERVYVATESRDARVNALLEQAGERISELEYAESHGMRSWFSPLREDAREEIEEAKREAGLISPRATDEAGRKAGEIIVDHEDSLRESVQQLPQEEKEEVEKWIDEETEEDEPRNEEAPQLEPEDSRGAPILQGDREGNGDVSGEHADDEEESPAVTRETPSSYVDGSSEEVIEPDTGDINDDPSPEERISAEDPGGDGGCEAAPCHGDDNRTWDRSQTEESR